MDFKLATRRIGLALQKESPTILTALGVTGFVTTVVMAVSATPKALRRIEIEEENKIDVQGMMASFIPLTMDEVVFATWKLYIPTAVMGLVSIACIVGANSINLQRNAALVSLYSLTETALKEYRAKVVERIGEKKEQDLRDDIAQDRLNNKPIDGSVILMGKGDVLFFDTLSSRYFKSSMEKVNRVVNEFNRDLLTEMYKTLNDFYNELGIEGTDMGRNSGWIIDQQGLLEVQFSTKIATNDEPCMVISYRTQPKPL